MKPKTDLVDAVLPPIVTSLVVLALWEGACRAWAIPAYLFPAPSAIAVALATDLPRLLGGLANTMKVTLAAFALAVVLGIATAFLFVQSRAIERSLFPYAVMLQVTPIVAIAPLIIILVKNTFAALTNLRDAGGAGSRSSPTRRAACAASTPGLRDLFALEKASPLQTLLRLRIPSALPFFFAGARISSGLALIGAVVAEFVAGTGGRSAGLASEILQSGYELAIPRMFAALLLITVAGVALFLAMAGLETLVLRGARAADRER